MKSLQNPDGKGLIEVVKELPTITEKISVLVYSAKVKDWVTFVSALSALVMVTGNAYGLNIPPDILQYSTATLLGIIGLVSAIKNKTE